MVKRKIVPIILSATILSAIIGNMLISNATDNNLKTFEEEKTIKVSQVEDYKKTLRQEINKDGITYKLENIVEKENIKVVYKNKEITKDLIVNTTDKYEVLDMFEQKLNVKEDEYTGTLKLDNLSISIKPNDSYREQYKVYYEEKYENVKSNELNDIPKTIKKDGIVYYLINPVWTVAETQNIDGQAVPVSYNGIMKYEAIKVRTIVSNYKATVKYSGELKKEVVDSVTFILQYEEIPIDKGENENKQSNMLPTVATTGTGIILCSGIIWLSRKNVLIYNYKNNKWNLIKKTKIKNNETKINITPIRMEKSRKYKIVLNNRLFNKLRNQNIIIKYYDKQFICEVKEKEIEIMV